jgi:adenosylmethionine-8-amino-7-oxononanoate aminotransferase
LEVCKSLPGVVDVRSKGAIGVVEVSDGSRLSELKKYFVSEGVWVRPFGDIIYLMPPFILTNRQLSYLTDTVSKITRFWSKL